MANIKDKVLISIDSSDLKDGQYYNKSVTEVADDCFNDVRGLVSVVLPKVKKIGSCCFWYNAALTTVGLPLLATCGSCCFWYNAALTTVDLPLLATCGSYCFWDNAALTTVVIGKKKLSHKCVDGSPFIVEAKKSSKGIYIYSGYNLLSINNGVIAKQLCFVAENDNFFAHGDTVKKAISDMQFKMVADKLKNEPINADTMITIDHYRLITGACDMGVRGWMEQNIKDGRSEIIANGIKAKDLLPLLKKTHAYGVEKFLSLVTFS